METKKINFPLIAGITFIVSAVLSLLGGRINAWLLFQLVGCGVLAFALLTNRRDIVLAIGFGVQALLWLVDLIMWAYVGKVAVLLGALGAAFLCVVYCTEYLPQYREKLCKFWFVPACVYAVGVLLMMNLSGVIYLCGMLFCLAWVVYPDGVPMPKRVESTVNENVAMGGNSMNMEAKPFRRQTLMAVLVALGIAIIGALFTASWDTFEVGIVLLSLAGAVFVLAVDFLLAKEVEYIAIEKGYNDKAYFWYTFLLGIFGILLVIALPKRDKDDKKN